MDLDALGLSPVADTPLLFLKGEMVLLAADLHIGIERELLDKGVRVPRQWPIILSTMVSALRETGARKLILLGDIKHRIPYASFSEEKDVPLFMNGLLEHAEVEIVLGNHDGWLRRLVPEGITIHNSSGTALGGIGLFHGHCWPSEDVMECSVLVMGHIHPSIGLSDAIGTMSIMPCWLRSTCTTSSGDKDVIIMPAVSRLRRGTPVNGGRGIGPLVRSGSIDLKAAGVYLLDGTYLGKAEAIP